MSHDLIWVAQGDNKVRIWRKQLAKWQERGWEAVEEDAAASEGGEGNTADETGGEGSGEDSSGSEGDDNGEGKTEAELREAIKEKTGRAPAKGKTLEELQAIAADLEIE